MNLSKSQAINYVTAKYSNIKENSSMQELLDVAYDKLLASAAPQSLVKSVTASDPELLPLLTPPFEEIFYKASSLALFACTIGEAVSKEFEALFASDQYTLALFLDHMASALTEQVAEELANAHSKETLGYAPGYCGFPIAHQKLIYDLLEAKSIGIALSSNFMLSPVKSTQGILVAAPMEVHRLLLAKRPLPACKDCKVHSCRERLK
ncbi:MAG: hypothetical protein HQK50_13490 [Oligoflexia bacterium]|nr:hypothetical protein [Oligoflexia bacterium]